MICTVWVTVGEMIVCGMGCVDVDGRDWRFVTVWGGVSDVWAVVGGLKVAVVVEEGLEGG